MDQNALEILTEIRDGAREGRRWRERAEVRFEGTEKALIVLTHQQEELSQILKVQLSGFERRLESAEDRLLTMERERGGGAVDVNISQANQTVGAEPAQTATKPGLLKPAATVGGSGLFGWLAGGGWEQITAFIKRLTG